jgi:hypothetical protein
MEEFCELSGYWFFIYMRQSEHFSLLQMLPPRFVDGVNQLNKLHVGVRSRYSHAYTPTFWCSDETDRSVIVHYIPGSAARVGFWMVTLGALKGFAEVHYRLSGVSVVKLEDVSCGENTETRFLVSWVGSFFFPFLFFLFKFCYQFLPLLLSLRIPLQIPILILPIHIQLQLQLKSTIVFWGTVVLDYLQQI